MIKKNCLRFFAMIIVLLLAGCQSGNDSNTKKDFNIQLFSGKWYVTEVVPVEIATPSTYSGFDENGVFRGQDLIDNIVGQEIFFGEDYIESRGEKCQLVEQYKFQNVPILSDDTIIGCTSAKTLGITGNNVSVVHFAIAQGDISQEGNRDFTSLNQLYLKDSNTIYSSVSGHLTFKLEREKP